jgi:polysaccharide biosynthesis protein PslG
MSRIPVRDRFTVADVIPGRPTKHPLRPAALVAVAALAAALVLALPTASARAQAPHFGFNDNWHLHQSSLDVAAAAGSDTIRTGMYWAGVEYKRDEYYWDLYDQFYSRILSVGMRPLFVVMNAPCWAAVSERACRKGHKNVLAQPPANSEYDEWAEFVGLVAQRYPQALALEIWNEPNLSHFWYPRPKPSRYADVLSTAAQGINAANPAMPVLSAGLVPTRHESKSKLGFKRFLKRVYKEGAAQLADGIGFHPYPAFWQRSTPRVVAKLDALMGSVRSIMSSFGEPGKDIWVTEVGLSTTGRPNGFSEGQQAEGLREIYRALSGMAGVPAVIVHRFFDQGGGPGNWETGLGVVSGNGVKKPAYCALAAERGAPC